MTLDEDGKPDTFSAQYHGERDAVADLFFQENWAELKRRGIDHHVRLKVIWSLSDLAVRPAGSLPRFEEGDLRLAISTRRRLPERVFLLLSRSEHASTGLIVNAYRWEGRQTSAEFSIPLTEVFGFQGEATRLKWRLIEPPLPSEWSFDPRPVRAQGLVEPGAVRSLEAPFAELVRQVQVRRANHRRDCERVPVYYDPLADI